MRATALKPCEFIQTFNDIKDQAQDKAQHYLKNCNLNWSWGICLRKYSFIHSLLPLACGVRLDFISMVLLVSPDEEVPLEVQNVSEQLSSAELSNREVSITLVLHCFQAALGTKYNLRALNTALQVTDQSVNVYYLNSFFFLTLNLKQTLLKSCSYSRQSSLRSWRSSGKPWLTWWRQQLLQQISAQRDKDCYTAWRGS